MFAVACQGFLNSILYVFASKEVRRKLFFIPLTRIAAKFKRGAIEQQEQIYVRSSVIVQREHRGQAPPQEDGTSTYFSFPTEFPLCGVSNDGHTVEQMNQSYLQARSAVKFPAARLGVQTDGSCTHLSLPSEFSASNVRLLERHQNAEVHPVSEYRSYTYFSLPSEFPSETKPSQ